MLDIPQDEYAAFVERHGLTYVGHGLYRWVYRTRSGRAVVKFPKSPEYGEDDNRIEAAAHLEGNQHVARCRLIRVAGFDCLVMEWVAHAEDPRGLPEWVDWIDCQQVGHNRRGRLVAYDFA